MKRLLLIISLMILLHSNASTQVTPFGLEGKMVTSIRVLDDVLYAGTTNDGVFRRSLTDTGWTSLGLEGKWIRSVYPHPVDASGFSLLAGTYGPLTMETRLLFMDYQQMVGLLPIAVLTIN